MPRIAASLLLITTVAALVGCGAGPSVQAAPAVRSAGPSAAAKAPRPGFRFLAYAGLSAEERRVLDASSLTVGQGTATATLGGQALYERLAITDPKLLANYMNQTAVLSSIRFANGRTALSYVERLDGLKINHVYAAVEPALHDEIKALAVPKSRPGAAYVGPEDSSLMHGKFGTSYRENRPYTSQQFAFSAQDGFAKVDIDLDEECPLAGSRVALAQHLVRALKHEILRKWPGTQYGENSEPDYFFRALSTPPTNADGRANKVGRGLVLSYQLE